MEELVCTKENGQFKKTTLALAIMFLVNHAYGQQQIYNDSSLGVLEQASSIDFANALSNLNATDTGLIYRLVGNSVTQGADLEVDFSNSVQSPQFVIGGYSNKGGLAESNAVTIKSGNINGSVYAGVSHSSTIRSSATVSSTNTDTSVNGSAVSEASISTATANDNHLNISGANAIVDGSVYGGSGVFYAQATKAEVLNPVSHSSFTSAQADAIAEVNNKTVEASANTTTIDSMARVNHEVYGGYTSIQAIAAETIANEATSTAAGAKANTNSYSQIINNKLTANNNKVYLNQANVGNNTSHVYGGASTLRVLSAKATSNSSKGDTAADSNANSEANARNNTLLVEGNEVNVAQSSVGGSVYGGYASISVHSNEATAKDSATISTTDKASSNAVSSVNIVNNNISVLNNKVDINQSSTVNLDVYGGYASIEALAGKATAGDANTGSGTDAYAFAAANANVSNNTFNVNNNKVLVDNTTVKGSVYGGYAGVTAKAGTAKKGTVNGVPPGGSEDININLENTKLYVNNNAVEFNGTLDGGGDIVGGYISFDLENGTAVTNGNTSNFINSGTVAQANQNIVTLGKDTVISNSNTSIYGGLLNITDPSSFPTPMETIDLFTGNTLNFAAKKTMQLKTVGNFQYYNFTIDPSLANSSSSLITADTIILGSNVDNFRGEEALNSEVKVVGIHSGKALSAGDHFYLMKSSDMKGDGKGVDTYGVAQQGVSLLYNVKTNVDVERGEVTATILNSPNNKGASVNPQIKAFSEGRLAGLSFVNQGQDMVMDQGIQMALASASTKDAPLTLFSTASTSSIRYKTGSHIDVDGNSLMGGVAWKRGNIVLAGFIEGGWGNYDSYNSFSTAANVHGKGDTNYYGTGLLGRYTLENEKTYIDGALRIGRTDTDFHTRDIVSAVGEKAKYKSKSTYYGASAGLGHESDINERTRFDNSVKYLWTHQNADSVSVAGDPIHFKSSDSHRLRYMGKFYHDATTQITLRGGLGYEYEFDGKAKATTYHTYDIKAPTLKGGSGIGEVGFSYTPTNNQRLTLDVKLNGYVGRKKGVGGAIQLEWR